MEEVFLKLSTPNDKKYDNSCSPTPSPTGVEEVALKVTNGGPQPGLRQNGDLTDSTGRLETILEDSTVISIDKVRTC